MSLAGTQGAPVTVVVGIVVVPKEIKLLAQYALTVDLIVDSGTRGSLIKIPVLAPSLLAFVITALS